MSRKVVDSDKNWRSIDWVISIAVKGQNSKKGEIDMEIKYSDYVYQVEKDICKYLEKELPNARACAYSLKSKSPFDLYLFVVIGYQLINDQEYWCVWESWNESTKSMNNGTYMLPHDEAWELFNDLTDGYYKAITANFSK